MTEKTMTVESILHRKIASILSKGDQGHVMGAYREAVKELREHNMCRFSGLTQQDFAAMDETMGFEHKAPTIDARDHSLVEQGSWVNRWLEAK